MWRDAFGLNSALCIFNYRRSHSENIVSQDFQGSTDGASLQDIEVWLVSSADVSGSL